MITTTDILQVSFTSALEAIRHGEQFVDVRLNDAVKSQKILIEPLGPVVTYQGLPYPVKEVSVPLIVREGEQTGGTSTDKISLVAFMIDKGIELLDRQLLRALNRYEKIIVSQNVRYALSPTYLIDQEGVQPHYTTRIYTAYCPIGVEEATE